MLKDNQAVTILPATDLIRAKKFYTEKLGLPATDIDTPPMVMLESGGGSKLMLYKRDEPTRAEHTVALWMVDDFDNTANTLLERGVVFEKYDLPGIVTDDRGIARLGNEKVAWFKDSEGNILSISEQR
ncbi:MAG: VOC family protein [Chitinispirillaceae bacterium]